jgi:hypothetical protein
MDARSVNGITGGARLPKDLGGRTARLDAPSLFRPRRRNRAPSRALDVATPHHLGSFQHGLDDHPAPPLHTDVHAGRWVRLGPRFDLADERAAILLISLVSDSGLSGALLREAFLLRPLCRELWRVRRRGRHSPHHQPCRRRTCPSKIVTILSHNCNLRR